MAEQKNQNEHLNVEDALTQCSIRQAPMMASSISGACGETLFSVFIGSVFVKKSFVG